VFYFFVLLVRYPHHFLSLPNLESSFFPFADCLFWLSSVILLFSSHGACTFFSFIISRGFSYVFDCAEGCGRMDDQSGDLD
jgi:hypothetical protein